jgi:hypothetical protein
MMSPELEELRTAYALELREAKDAAERWWERLQERYRHTPGHLRPEELWPLGPVSHPGVIAVYRKYFFKCVELNQHGLIRAETVAPAEPTEADWGLDDAAKAPAGTVEPKTFVLDLLSGGDTHDLYEFLLSLAFIPIGRKSGELV